MGVSMSEHRELVMDREAWRAAIHGVTKSRTQVSDWTELNLRRGHGNSQITDGWWELWVVCTLLQWVSEVGAVLWDWALNQWDLSLTQWVSVRSELNWWTPSCNSRIVTLTPCPTSLPLKAWKMIITYTSVEDHCVRLVTIIFLYFQLVLKGKYKCRIFRHPYS